MRDNIEDLCRALATLLGYFSLFNPYSMIGGKGINSYANKNVISILSLYVCAFCKPHNLQVERFTKLFFFTDFI